MKYTGYTPNCNKCDTTHLALLILLAGEIANFSDRIILSYTYFFTFVVPEIWLLKPVHFNANVQSIEIEWYVNLANSVQLCPLRGGRGLQPPCFFRQCSQHTQFQLITLVSTPIIMCTVTVRGNKINVLDHNYTDCECNNCMRDSIYYNYNKLL